YLYLSMTAFSILLFWLAGNAPFDAVCNGFSAIATGGFANHDLSLGYYQSTAVDLAAIVSMLLGAISFGTHFFIWRSANPLNYWRDSETRTFLLMVIGAGVLTTGVLLYAGTYVDLPNAAV